MQESNKIDDQIVTVVKLFLDLIREILNSNFNQLNLLETNMATLKDAQAKQQEAITAVNNAVTRVIEDNTAQNNEIQKLKDQIKAGNPITEADLDSLVAGNTQIIDTMNNLDPIPPVVVPPTV